MNWKKIQLSWDRLELVILKNLGSLRIYLFLIITQIFKSLYALEVVYLCQHKFKIGWTKRCMKVRELTKKCFYKKQINHNRIMQLHSMILNFKSYKGWSLNLQWQKLNCNIFKLESSLKKIVNNLSKISKTLIKILKLKAIHCMTKISILIQKLQ